MHDFREIHKFMVILLPKVTFRLIFGIGVATLGYSETMLYLLFKWPCITFCSERVHPTTEWLRYPGLEPNGGGNSKVTK